MAVSVYTIWRYGVRMCASCILMATLSDIASYVRARHIGEEVTYAIPVSGEYPRYQLGTAAPCDKNNKRCIRSLSNDAIRVGTGSNADTPCFTQGTFKEPINWHGYLAQVVLRPQGGTIRYHITYPEEKCCFKLLLYRQIQVVDLRAKSSCLQRNALLDPDSHQIMSLSPMYNMSGCTRNLSAEGRRVISCTNTLHLRTNRPTRWSVAVSSCGSPQGLDFSYSLVITGVHGDSCNTVTKSYASPISSGHARYSPTPPAALAVIALAVCWLYSACHR